MELDDQCLYVKMFDAYGLHFISTYLLFFKKLKCKLNLFLRILVTFNLNPPLEADGRWAFWDFM